MLEKRILRIREDFRESVLLPLLIGKVFHVTKWDACESILRAGRIEGNQRGDRPLSFHQAVPSYGVRRGHVCLFDLREFRLDSCAVIREKLDFVDPWHCHHYGYFILRPRAYRDLIPWTTAVDEVNYREKFIPEAECWYPTGLPLELIHTLYEVIILRRPHPPPLSNPPSFVELVER